MAIANLGSANISGPFGGDAGTLTGLSTPAGAALILTARVYNADSSFTAPVSITDSASNSWVYATVPQDTAPPDVYLSEGGADHIGSFIGWSIGAASVTSVTVTLNGSYDGGEFTVSWWSGIASYGPGGTVSENTTAENISPALAVPAGGLYIAGVQGPASWSLPSGATALTSNDPNAFVYQVFSTQQSSVSFDWDAESADYVASAMVFEPPAVPGPAPSVLYSMRTFP